MIPRRRRHAGLAVLDRDYFDAKKVSDEDINLVQPVMTVVGGKVVFDDPARL